MVRLRLDRILEMINRIEPILRDGVEDYRGNFMKQAALERYLQVAAQAVIDIATHIVAVRYLGSPTSYADAVISLGREHIIDGSLTARLADLVKVRNILVHMYLQADQDVFFESAQETVRDLRELVDEISRMLSS
ncbi:MAG: type VII toxin-antitoxin system HepT family RNase toxin [Candidatus Thorarchaeota archaeon]